MEAGREAPLRGQPPDDEPVVVVHARSDLVPAEGLCPLPPGGRHPGPAFRIAQQFADCRGEHFGIVLLEAMAAGVPIVCSDIHGYKGVVKRGEQALLVPPRDPEVLAAAIGELLGDPERRARMAASGRERAKAFGWDQVAARVDDYYGFVIRRLAAQGRLPSGFHGEIPPAGHVTQPPPKAPVDLPGAPA